jgi:hypothetical protein
MPCSEHVHAAHVRAVDAHPVYAQTAHAHVMHAYVMHTNVVRAHAMHSVFYITRNSDLPTGAILAKPVFPGIKRSGGNAPCVSLET